MRAVLPANAALLVAAVALSALLALRGHHRTLSPASAAASDAGRSRRVALEGGGFALLDATGHPVPLRPYRRIVSTTMLTDRLLVELCEADRVLAVSAAGARGSPFAYQYAGKPTAEGLDALEPLIALKPDLVLMNHFGDPGRVTRLRGAGVEVFDLGQMRGLATLRPTAEAIAELVGHPERGARFLRSFEHRMATVAAGLGNRRRRTAVYVSVIGPSLSGGTTGTSYHDVLVAAGLVDAAASRFKNWLRYSPEQLIALAPEVLVTKEGMAAVLCGYPGLADLPACRAPGGVIELPSGLIEDPGPTMLDAAELLFARAYPQVP
jgi:iron complex transport system substrate-binding protein